MTINYHLLPSVNAVLNATSAVLLVAGFLCIRAKRIAAHRACMVSAVMTSTLFLISYVTYHAHVGTTRFPGRGWPRAVYLSILSSHTLLAILIVPLVITTLLLAVRQRFITHRALARWTWPLWLYVSVTGVIIYWMLYRVEWARPHG